MANIICPYCGNQADATSAFCPKCGARLQTAPPPQPPQTQTISTVTLSDVIDAPTVVRAVNAESIHAAKKMLYASETPLYATCANVSIIPKFGALDPKLSIKNKEPGVFVVTDQRVFFVKSIMLLGNNKDIPISSITSVDAQNSMFTSELRIQSPTEMIIVTCNKKVQQKIQLAISQALAR